MNLKFYQNSKNKYIEKNKDLTYITVIDLYITIEFLL